MREFRPIHRIFAVLHNKLSCLKPNFSRLLIFLFSFLFLQQVSACEIDIYSYVEPDNIRKVYHYKSITEAALPEMNFEDVAGKYIYTPIHSETNDTIKTLTVNVMQEQLPDYYPTDYTIQYRRIPGDGYFSLEFDATGNSTEHLILPECIKVGSNWETSSFWDKEELVSQGQINLPIGHFDNCLTIRRIATERTDASKKVGERQISQSIRCEGIGLVSSTITNKINAVNFQTVTTMVLESHQSLN